MQKIISNFKLNMNEKNDELENVLRKLGYTNNTIEVYLSNLAHKYYIRFKKREKELSYWINLVDVMNLGCRGSGKNENGHSRFLYELFRYSSNGTHSIFNSFIRQFTGRKDFKSKSGENKIILNYTFTETGRHPDIYINQLEEYDSEKTISVVFENKIDCAEDRKQQMEDYIKGMYKERNNKDNICDLNCYAFYLIPDYTSVKINDDEHDDFGRQKIINKEILDELIPNRNYILLSYKEDILPWLKNNICQLFYKDEKYLVDNIKLYIQYLENRFELREDINSLKIKIMNEIENINNLNLEDLTTLQDALSLVISKQKDEIINNYIHKFDNTGFEADKERRKGSYDKGFKYKLTNNFSIWCEININESNKFFHIGLAVNDKKDGNAEQTYANYKKNKSITPKAEEELFNKLKRLGIKDDTGNVKDEGYALGFTFKNMNLDSLKDNINNLPQIIALFKQCYAEEDNSTLNNNQI